MNQNALKPFAQTARRELRKQIELRLDFVLRTDSAELRQRAAQVKALKEALALEGREALVERVAYTWFNRLAALRFMDANGYHPFGARVVTAASAQETLPEVLQQARAGVLNADLRSQLDTAETFDGVLSGAIPTASREGSAYRMLLVAACHYYHRLMPFLFEKLGDATELLLPEDLLTEQSVVNPFRTELADADCRDVEVIGWLYQFYISEKKDAVMARKAAVPTEDIPAVTQLFTPHWIVRYLVENSLGRLWLLNRPTSRLREKMPYYIEGEAETDFLKITKPEEIKLLDPAGGSGHMLTYAYDLLYAIYEEEGYDAPEIPGLILKHNLHGIDICDRAAALAAFALVMKARGSDNRFFRRFVPPQVIALQDVRFEEGELSTYFKALGVQPSALHSDFNRLLHQFEEAKNFGSLIQPCLTEAEIHAVRSSLVTGHSSLGNDLMIAATHIKVLRVLDQAVALTRRYHVIAANPPYMAAAAMNPKLKDFVEANWEAGKADTYSAFILRNLKLAYSGGRVAMITTPNWMFLKGFESLREQLLQETQISSLVHCGRGVWGGDFGSCAFVIQSSKNAEMPGVFKRLFKRPGEIQSNEEIEANFFNVADFPNYTATGSSFRGITGLPIAYWISKAFINVFQESEPLIKRFQTRLGLSTANNERFLRLWFEVAQSTIKMDAASRDIALKSGKRWFPYQKGGAFRKWFGNGDLLVDWSDDGREIKNFGADQGRIRSHNYNLDYIFREGVTWSDVTSGRNAFRYMPSGQLFDGRGSSGFAIGDTNWRVVLGLLNTSLSYETIGFINPTIAINVGEIGRIPYHKSVHQIADRIVNIVDECILLARTGWDNFETSWDFRDQPLLRPGLKGAALEASWRNWEAQSTAAIRRMQELETENNRLFINTYGLEGELQPEVPEEQITLTRADVRKDVAAFLSYAIGCMMGRYSLDQPGLVLANAGSTVADYLARIPTPTFTPDADGILPVLDGEWFADDVVSRLGDFLRTTFSKDTLAENLGFIETALGKELRKYFAKEFYKDHLKTYKKRPIYWMVSSPEGSFQALIYLHRYTRDTVNTLLTDYVREFLHKLEAREQELTAVTLNESSRPAEKTQATRELGKIAKMLKEIRAWERDVVLPLAQQRIELDLDDGVKVNYLKFPGLLVPIPGLDKKEDE
jgi:hypothetical protein